jgi:queuosine precursor transporter
MSPSSERLNSHRPQGDIKQPKYFDLIGMAFIAVLLISTIAAQKLFVIGPLVLPAGILLFPLAYIFGDVLTEVYGYSRSRRIVWMGFAMSLLAAIFFTLAVALPPAPGWPMQESFAAVLGFVPRVVFASLVAYLCGEFINAYVLAKLKLRTQGKHLWLRTIGSTLLGEGVDTAIFMTIAFAAVLPTPVLLSAIVSSYLVKVSYEIAATPITYAVVNALKRAEGIDHYDVDTNFNPFQFR